MFTNTSNDHFSQYLRRVIGLLLNNKKIEMSLSIKVISIAMLQLFFS